MPPPHPVSVPITARTIALAKKCSTASSIERIMQPFTQPSLSDGNHPWQLIRGPYDIGFSGVIE
jgi:hypothetical protein